MGTTRCIARCAARFGFMCALGIVMFNARASAATYDDVTHHGDDAAYKLLASAEFAQVGAIVGQDSSGSSWLCSATVIAADWALTAAHCLDGDIQRMTFGSEFDVSSWAVAGTTRDVIKWVPHPDYNGDLAKGKDIGLIQFSSPVDIPPSPLFTGSDERGLMATSVGFGVTGKGSLQGMDNRILDGNKRATTNQIDVHFITRGKTNDFYGVDFDNPSDPSDSSFGSSDPTELEGNSLFGDSGGGSFVWIDGSHYEVAGVTSFVSAQDGNVDGDYGDRAGYTRVSLFADWINSTMSGGSSGGGGKGGGNGGNKKKAEFGSVVDLASIDAVTLQLSGPVAVVPEPSSFTLVLLGMLGLLRMRSARR